MFGFRSKDQKKIEKLRAQIIFHEKSKCHVSFLFGMSWKIIDVILFFTVFHPEGNTDEVFKIREQIGTIESKVVPDEEPTEVTEPAEAVEEMEEIDDVEGRLKRSSN